MANYPIFYQQLRIFQFLQLPPTEARGRDSPSRSDQQCLSLPRPTSWKSLWLSRQIQKRKFKNSFRCIAEIPDTVCEQGGVSSLETVPSDSVFLEVNHCPSFNNLLSFKKIICFVFKVANMNASLKFSEKNYKISLNILKCIKHVMQ